MTDQQFRLLEPVEIGGLIMKQHDEKIDVYDLNYGTFVGHLVLEEGPGWILVLGPRANFLDVSQLRALIKFSDEHLDAFEVSVVGGKQS